jgi:membrane protease YdiL (CAAX protease family)
MDRQPPMPWRALTIFLAIAVGTTTAIAIVCFAAGWTVESRAWALLVPIAMWAPAAGAFVARRTVDRAFVGTLPLARWGVTGPRVVLRPLVIPLVVYAAAYAIAWRAGLAHWNPGEGRWTSAGQIAANLVINLSVLGVFGTFTAMGEEIGWRGYLQPRLDAAGIRRSVVVVWLCQLAYHVPLMLGAGYVDVGGFGPSVALFAIGDLPMTFIIARESYLARSVWPAIFLHSFHNTISQWLFPKLFTLDANQIWLRGEDGILPMAGYVVVGAMMLGVMLRRGPSWSVLARRACEPAMTSGPSPTAALS